MRKLLWFALPFGAGCALCWYILPEGQGTYIAAGIAVLGLSVSLLLRGKPGKIIRLAAIGCAAGCLWFSGYSAMTLQPAEALAGTRHVLEMELTDYPEEASGGAKCRVKVEGLRGEGIYYGGWDLLDLEPGNRVVDQVTAYSARTIAGEENGYYISGGVYIRFYGSGSALAVGPGNAGSWKYLPVRLSRWLRESAEELYGEETAGLITAMLTGQRDGLGIQEYTDLSESGLMHITAVSGLHCGFLIALLGVVLFRRQRLTAALGYPVLLLYMAIVGCTPSVVRSCVMVGFMLMAPLVGREGDTPTALAGALLVILLADPFAIASVSLQLSFAAVAGLLVLSEKIYQGFEKLRPEMLPETAGKIWTFCAGSISASLGVMAATVPLSAAYFGTLALITPLSNLAVLWMTPGLFASGLIVTVLAGLLPALAPLAVVPEMLAKYLLWAAGWLAKIPGHGVYFTRNELVSWLIGTYVLLGICLLIRGHGWKWCAVLGISALSLALIKAAPRQQVKNDRLTAVVADVGQGAAALFHSGGMTVLIDCGSLNYGKGAGTAVADAMDQYGWDTLNYIVLTHYHDDHADGLSWLLARVEAEQMLLPQLFDSDQGELQRDVLSLAERYGVAVKYIEHPEAKRLGDAVLTVYPPLTEGGGNEAGLTILCSAGEYDFLITGDMDSATEKMLVSQYQLPDIEVLLAGHHGSKNSTSNELLETVTPEIGIISVGRNTYGHPTPEAIERMTNAGMEIYRTDEDGNILIQIPR